LSPRQDDSTDENYLSPSIIGDRFGREQIRRTVSQVAIDTGKIEMNLYPRIDKNQLLRKYLEKIKTLNL